MARKILIVGNGEIDEAAAAVIDAADMVIRFNDCRSYGPGGARTDIVAVCNTGRPAKDMLGSAGWRSHPAVVQASEIWSVRDPVKFAALSRVLAVSHPDLDDFCDDYTEGFDDFAARSGKTHKVIDGTMHEAVEHALAEWRPAPYVAPSSGMIVVGYMLATFPEDEIVLAGFRHSGWQWHPFTAEKLLVDSHIAAGRLKRFAKPALISTAQGA